MLTREQLEKLANIEESLLNEYDYNWTRYGILQGLKIWNRNKTSLRNILRKHPNWNEDMQLILFDTDFKRELDEGVLHDFSQWIKFCPVEAQEDEDRNIKFANYIKARTEHVLDETTANYFNEHFPELKARVGQRITKIVNKYCIMYGLDKEKVFSLTYNQAYAKYCDAITPLKIKRHTIISINPIDYLTMSFGNSWASCHTIDKENKRGMENSYSGCYSSGTMSYMLDSTSIVFYTIDASYNGNRPFMQPKINRNMFHYDNIDNIDVLIQGRLYPQSCDGDTGMYKDIRMIMQKVFADCLNINNLWMNKKGTDVCDELIESEGTHYPDYKHFDTCNVSIPKEQFTSWDLEGGEMYVGHYPICPDCGREHEEEENICCENCSDERQVCADCGARRDEDDMFYINGDWYCDECVYYCEECNEYERTSNAAYRNGNEIYVCDECLDNYYTYCDACEEYHRDRDMTRTEEGYVYCENCVDDNAIYIEYKDNYYESDNCCECEQCGKYFLDDDINYDGENNAYYCDDCLEEIEEAREEKAERETA